MRSKSVRNLILTVSLMLNLCIAIIILTPLTEQLYKPLIIDEPLRKSEAIIVLSGCIYRSGLPAFMTLTRLRKARELYRNKWADKIICIGGTRLDKINKSVSEVMKETLILNGIAEEDILIQDETRNTYDDISRLLVKFDKEFDFNKTIFVTSSFHTYRVKKILEKKRINAIVVSAEPYELYPHFKTSRLALFRIVAREYLAICYFKIKGWI